MIILKLQLGEEVRRIGKAPDDISIVKRRASELFGLEQPCFRYIDNEGEKITVITQEEYLEIFSLERESIKLEVLEEDLLLLQRSSCLRSSMREEPHFFKCDSFNDSSKLSIILPYEEPPKKAYQSVMVQTEDILQCEKETAVEQSEDVGVEACLTQDTEVSFESSIDHYQELVQIIRKQLCTPAKESKKHMGVACYYCNCDIYDVLYRCNLCAWLYLCENCEVSDRHIHTLVKSRNKVQRFPGPPPPCIIEPRMISDVIKVPVGRSDTLKGSREELNKKVEELKVMGFTDEIKCIEVLIKNAYSIEKSVEMLLNR